MANMYFTIIKVESSIFDTTSQRLADKARMILKNIGFLTLKY